MDRYYFDWAATTKISKNALAKYNEIANKYWANPSALHQQGEEVHTFLENQRELTAQLLKVQPKQIFYTSGATESNSIVLNSLLLKETKRTIISSFLEHNSILNYYPLLERNGFKIDLVKSPGGYFDLEQFKQKLSKEVQLVNLMLVNNLFGTVQDVKEVASIIREFEIENNWKIHLHCDATQAVGKIDFDLNELDVDSASFSAHKFEGPKGVGILFLKSGTIDVLSRSGGQERNIRGGTEDICAISSMNVALKESLENLEKNANISNRLKESFEEQISKSSVIKLISPSVNSQSKSVANIITVAVKNIPSEVTTRVLDEEGFSVSSGSACSNNKANKNIERFTSSSFSSDDGKSAIRISFSPYITKVQIELLAKTLVQKGELLNSVIRKK
ncbi:MAG: cysteine desulfurase family protein [Sphaerochaetaceae bacterium]|jgi:cysteine desulfurase